MRRPAARGKEGGPRCEASAMAVESPASNPPHGADRMRGASVDLASREYEVCPQGVCAPHICCLCATDDQISRNHACFCGVFICIGRPPWTNCSPCTWSVRLAASDAGDRKSTRLNSSHVAISYAV